MAFFVGQEVECIRENWRVRWGQVNTPVLNQKYTIREICLGMDDREGLRLTEITNIECVRYVKGRREVCEPHFWSDHFRPLQKTSLKDILEAKAPKDSAAWDNRLVARPNFKSKERAL